MEISRWSRLVRRFATSSIHFLSSTSIFNIYGLDVVFPNWLEWILHSCDNRLTLFISSVRFYWFTSLLSCDFTLEIQIFCLYQITLLRLLSLWMRFCCNWFWLLCVGFLLGSMGKLVNCGSEYVQSLLLANLLIVLYLSVGVPRAFL